MGRRRRRRHLAHRRRARRARPTWIAPPDDLPTNAFGSLIVDADDATGNTLYAGSGEPNGSGDSEAGLGLFKSTDGGDSWTLVAGQRGRRDQPLDRRDRRRPGATRTRSTSAPTSRATARRRSTAAAARRRTPRRSASTSRPTAARPSRSRPTSRPRRRRTRRPPASRRRLVPGRHQQARARPERPDARLRRRARLRHLALDRRRHDWTQVFHTVNQNDFADPTTRRDTFGDRTEFDLVDARRRTTRVYLGDASDDCAIDDALAHAPQARATTSPAIARSGGNYDNSRLDRAVEHDQRHDRLPRLRLVPERPVRLRRLRRASPPGQPGRASGSAAR